MYTSHGQNRGPTGQLPLVESPKQNMKKKQHQETDTLQNYIMKPGVQPLTSDTLQTNHQLPQESPSDGFALAQNRTYF